jgi:hypothetical protein
MKQIVLLLVLTSAIGCTKEKDPNSIVGSWTLSEINSGDSSSIFLLRTELSVNFKSGGSFEILGPKANYTFLRDFNQYKIVGDDKIQFSDSTSQNQLLATFYVNQTLSLLYEGRCPYEEKFIRR